MPSDSWRQVETVMLAENGGVFSGRGTQQMRTSDDDQRQAHEAAERNAHNGTNGEAMARPGTARSTIAHTNMTATMQLVGWGL